MTDPVVTNNPASGVLALLKVASGVLAGSQDGWTFAVGDMLAKPNQFVSIRNIGGKSAEPGLAIDYPTVQILCRGDVGPNGYPDGYSKARAVRDALLGIPNGGTDYPELTMITQIGHIQDLGRDDQSRPLFSVNLQLTESRDTAGYRT